MPDEREVQAVRRGASKKKLDISKASVRYKFITSEAKAASPYIHIEPQDFEPLIVQMAPAPQFLFTDEGSFAHLYTAHYDRLCAVVEAARWGNASLIRLSLAELDRLGSSKDSV